MDVYLVLLQRPQFIPLQPAGHLQQSPEFNKVEYRAHLIILAITEL